MPASPEIRPEPAELLLEPGPQGGTVAIYAVTQRAHTHTHTLSHSLSLSLTHTHTHTLTHTLSMLRSAFARPLKALLGLPLKAEDVPVLCLWTRLSVHPFACDALSACVNTWSWCCELAIKRPRELSPVPGALRVRGQRGDAPSPQPVKGVGGDAREGSSAVQATRQAPVSLLCFLGRPAVGDLAGRSLGARLLEQVLAGRHHHRGGDPNRPPPPPSIPEVKQTDAGPHPGLGPPPLRSAQQDGTLTTRGPWAWPWRCGARSLPSVSRGPSPSF